MKQKLTLLMLSVFMVVAYSYSQGGLGTLKGTVRDAVKHEPIPFCKISIIQNGTVKGNAETDFDGKFQINSLDPGSYDVGVRNEAEGYQPTQLTGVRLNANQITFLDDLTLEKPKDVREIEEVKIVAYKVPLINKDGGASGQTMTREDLARMPIRSAAAAAGLVGGVNVSENGDMSIRGSRSDASYFYIDGIKVRGSSNLPKSALEEVSVLTGGIPANYGDVVGGIVSITTRGPSSKYFGSAELVSSGIYFHGKDKLGYDSKVIGFDKFGYNLFEGMLSGPLLMKKDSTGAKTKPILGFLISGNITDQIDPRPTFGGQYRIKKEVREQLLENPLRPTPSGQSTYNNTNFLHASDFEQVPFKMNLRSTNISGQTKIDVRTGPNVNLSFGGSLNYSRSTTGSTGGIDPNSLMNFNNYGITQGIDWRVFGRLTQRFSNTKEGSSSKIKSAFYTIMVDFSQTASRNFDKNHRFNVFDYGYIGKYDITAVPSYSWDNKKLAYVEDGRKEVNVAFTPSDKNPDLTAITRQYYSMFGQQPIGYTENITQIRAGNALVNGQVPNSVYDLYNNVGTPYNGVGKGQNNQFRLSGSGSVNIGDHSLTLGFEFEQRADRYWQVNGPIGLWNTARQLVNGHIQEFDDNKVTITQVGGFNYINKERLNSGGASKNDGVYQGQVNAAGIGDNQSFFDYNLRKKLNLNPAGNDFINVDAVDPSLLSIDMFSADELMNSGNPYVSYNGYDYMGNKTRGGTSIKDYFTKFDKNGNYTRNLGAFQPTYMSGYIMDKFAFNDLIFNLGLRVDVFDANQSVLKDPYLLYQAKTVSEVKAEDANIGDIPESMGDDYVVYVNDVNNPTAITGYRKENTWYDAQGNEVSDSKVVRGAGGIQPYLTQSALQAYKSKKMTEDAFQDYKAKVYFMPRIAFSFPISDEASFFAHYDILTQRPGAGTFRLDPVAYQFVTQSQGAVINNPNLKAKQTIDYEIGFQQVLTKTSSLKISAFYREQRNDIQMVNVFDAYPATYKTYGNRDFGTVKGLTVAYDLRRTGNTRMTLAYTLQFADGTGSNSASAASLIAAGLPNLRTIFPYNYDQRHNFAYQLDYRYGEGKDYNGPVIKGLNILENTGLNLISNIYSGSPYSTQAVVTNSVASSAMAPSLTGTTNGSRLPWQYKLDMQIDKTINVKYGKGDKKKQTFLNVYVRITNLLNQQNLLGVYRATGNWNDDGYLAAAASQTSIQNQMDQQAFRDYYTMKVQNAFNISSPRTIRLGVKFDF